MKLTFVGTGVSCAIPVIGHLTTDCACRDAIRDPDGPNRRNNVALLISLPFPARMPHAAREHQTSGAEAAVAQKEEEEEWHHVLIDCGKTFRSAYMRVLAPMRVRYVDALLLTHGHADAMHCVEELCSMQAEAAAHLHLHASHPPPTGAAEQRADHHCSSNTDETPRTLRRIPTYLTYPTLEQIEMISPDLVQSSYHMGAAPATRSFFAQVMRETEGAVSSFANTASPLMAPMTVMDLFFLDEAKPQRIHVPIGPLASHVPVTPAIDDDPSTVYVPAPTPVDAELPFYSFPVEHGPRYISMCFAFGRGIAFKSQQQHSGPSTAAHAEGSCVVYISDVSSIPEASMTFLLDLVKIDILILDLLAEHGAPSASHYCADEAIPMVAQLTPRKTYFVGMFCSLEHHSTNSLLAQELAELKAAYRAELALTAESPSASAADATERARKQRFLDEVQTMELAYDGQQLNVEA